MTHGWNDGGGGGKNVICEDHWVSNMARKIHTYENDQRKLKKTVTIGICWNSSPWVDKDKGESRSLPPVGKICFADKARPSIYIVNACTTAKIGEYIGTILRSIKHIFGKDTNIETHGIGR